MTPKILTVDDSRIVRMLISRALQGYGCQIVEATNGEEGFAAALQESPDLILLDVTMPVMDGFELLSRLRSEPSLAKVPVIMLTAEASQESVARADGLGVSGYVAKPFTEEGLRARISQVISLTATA